MSIAQDLNGLFVALGLGLNSCGACHPIFRNCFRDRESIRLSKHSGSAKRGWMLDGLLIHVLGVS